MMGVVRLLGSRPQSRLLWAVVEQSTDGPRPDFRRVHAVANLTWGLDKEASRASLSHDTIKMQAMWLKVKDNLWHYKT